VVDDVHRPAELDRSSRPDLPGPVHPMPSRRATAHRGLPGQSAVGRPAWARRPGDVR
jgi:hypothetical protein